MLWKVFLYNSWWSNFERKLSLGRRQSAGDPSKSTCNNLSLLDLTEVASWVLLANVAAVIYTAANSACFPRVIFVFSNSVWANLDADSLCTAWDLNVELSVIKSYRNNSSSSKDTVFWMQFLKTGLEWHKRHQQLRLYILSQGRMYSLCTFNLKIK